MNKPELFHICMCKGKGRRAKVKQSNLWRQLGGILKILLAAFLMSGILLALLALIMLKFGLSQNAANTGILVIYALSCFFAGMIAGKSKGKQKFLWGMLTGGCYFFLLLLGSLAFQQGLGKETAEIMLAFAICTGAGMVGGMIS